MRRVFSSATLLGVAVSLWLVRPAWAADEPVFRGQKASEWAAVLRGEAELKKQMLARLAIGNLAARPGSFRTAALLRRTGLVALQIIGPEKYPEGVQVIVTSLQNDPEEEVRAATASALGAMYDKVERGRFGAAREALANALRRDPSARVREAAARALGKLDPEEARATVLILNEALGDSNQDVRDAAVETLGRLGKDAAEALPGLVNLLKDDKARELTRTQAALAIGRIGAPAAVQAGALPVLEMVIADTGTTENLRIAAIASAGFIGREAAPLVKPIAAWLVAKSTSIELRRKAAEVLDGFGLDARAAEKELRQAMKDDDKLVRVLAVHAVSILVRELPAAEQGAVVRSFLEALSDPAADVRIAAINAVAQLPPEFLGDARQPIVERLTALTRDTQRDIAEAATAALAKLKPT